LKFSIQQEDLQKVLDVVASVVPSKTTLPILTSILCEAKGTELRFSATNLDISVTTTTETAKIAREGIVAIPALKLVSFVRSLAAGPVSIEEKEGRIVVKAGKAALEEASMNADEYPALPELAADDGLTIDADVLTTMIAETSYAVSRDETRPALMGILWEVRSDGLTLVATDAHRLALSRRAVDWDAPGDRDLIVDVGGLKQLSRVTAGLERESGGSEAGGTASVDVFLGDNQLSFRAGKTILHTRLLEGPFPDYKAVLPKDNDKLFVVDRELLGQSVRRVSITADRITSQIKLGLEEGRLELQARGTDGSRAEDEIDVAYKGEPIEIGFNFSYLQDILKNVRSTQVQVSVKDPQSAAVIEPVGEAGETDGGLLCLLMPLRLTSD
jgi:DNA polymerase-3 subunit beta